MPNCIDVWHDPLLNEPSLCGWKQTYRPRSDRNFSILNGQEISASVDEQESIVLAIATGELRREAFVEWLQQHTVPVNNPNPTDG